MAKVILTTAHTPIAPAAGSTRYWKVGIGALFNTVTEALAQVPYRSAGTFSKLYVRVTANTATATSILTLRKNAADTGITLSIAAGATGAFENTVNTETISAGDLINYKTVSGGTGTVTFSLMSIIFDATTNCVSKLITETYTLTAAASRFTPHVGDVSSVSSSGTTQNLTIKKAVTIKNLAVYVPANARTTNTSVILRKNSVDQTALVTFGNVETGLKEDTTHPITTAANDLNDYKMTTGAGTETITLQFHAMEVEHPTHGFISSSSVGAAADQTQNAGLTRYVPISGSTKTHTVEANTQQKARHAFVFTELMFRTTANTLDGNTTLTLRKNGTDTALTCTIGATIGVVGDSTNAVTVEPDDLINYKVVTTGTTGNVQLKHLAVWAEPQAVVVPPVVEETPTFGGGRVRRVYLGKRVIEEPPRPKTKIKTTIKRINAGKSQPLQILSAPRLMLLDEQPGVTLEITGIIKQAQRRVKIKRMKLPASSQSPLTITCPRLALAIPSHVTVAFESVAVLNASQIGLRMFDIDKYDQRTQRLQRLYKLLKITSYFESLEN